MSESFKVIRHREIDQYPEVQPNAAEQLKERGGSVEISVCGELDKTLEQNQQEYGRHIAQEVVASIERAKQQGKRLVLDMATGASPVPVWNALRELHAAGSLDTEGVIFMGHEEGWGNIKPGSIVDFDGDRRSVVESLGVKIDTITSVDQVSGDEVQGNFIQMHLSEDYRDATRRVREIMNALRQREDVVYLGLYGVGTDGHVDEMQIDTMGMHGSARRMDTFLDLDPGVLPAEGYQPNSYERGFYKWANPDYDPEDPESEEFLKENNVFNYRGKKEGELYGRPAFQDSDFGSVDHIMGLGWRDMLSQEKIILMFNNPGKSLAFQLALEGSFDSSIVNATGDQILEVEHVKGEGEDILEDLRTYALQLQAEFPAFAGMQGVEDAHRSAEILRQIYRAMDRVEASSQDPAFIPVFEQMWRFVNRYVGRRAPVSRLLKMREMFGLETELVAVPQVVSGTPYEQLAQ